MGDLLTCFKWLCKLDANYATCHALVYSCTWCAEATGIPLKRVRNAMKRLAAYGYVKKDFEGGYNDWFERVYCIHGYSITDKGRATAIWKAYETAEIERIKKELAR